MICMKVSIENGIPFSIEQGIQGPKAIYLKRRKVTRTEIVKGICNQKVYVIILFPLVVAILHLLQKVVFASYRAFRTNNCLNVLLLW